MTVSKIVWVDGLALSVDRLGSKLQVISGNLIDALFNLKGRVASGKGSKKYAGTIEKAADRALELWAEDADHAQQLASGTRYVLRAFEVTAANTGKPVTLRGAYDVTTGTFPNGGWLNEDMAQRDVDMMNDEAEYFVPTANNEWGRQQLREAREGYRLAYVAALDRKKAGDETAQEDMDDTREGMARIDAKMLEAKLARCEVQLVARRITTTGRFLVTYWDGTAKESKTETLGLQETFDHINRKGWPTSIRAELESGGATFATLKMSQWDDEYSCYWYSIWTMAGDKLAEEIQVN